jgi:hypothetical protein
VTIDGYSQPGASENTLTQGSDAVLKIEISGANTDVAELPEGLVIGSGASNSVVRGLVINRFYAEGIRLNGSNNKVEGNFIGTNVAGTADLGNATHGVVVGIGTAGNTIGGTSPEDRNVISGNGNYGVVLHQTGSNKVRGNLIGTAKDGTSPLGNFLHGVTIQGNNNSVGGTTSGAANTIAFSGSDGVLVSLGFGHRILRNSIRSNGALGIDLNGGLEVGGGITANDPKDPDTGANRLQNFPVLASATTSGNETTVKGKLNSRPERKFTVQFFSNFPLANVDEGVSGE